MKDELTKTGYGQEEEYFYKLNKELIERRRQELDKERHSRESSDQRSAHWLKCPKCGADMAEVDLKGIKIDRCGSCQGVYFDHGELDLLLQAKEPHGFLANMRRAFKA
jgi:hypothetical protein